MLLTHPRKPSISYRTIKNNHIFLVDDETGFIPENNEVGLGLYHLDTRFLNCLEIRINHTEPVCLFSSTEAGHLSTLIYTNGQMESKNIEGVATMVDAETIQLKRETIIEGALFEKITVSSYNIEPVQLEVSFRFDADFRDIFEIRHLVPFKHRELDPPTLMDRVLVFAYTSPDKIYETQISFTDFIPSFTDTRTAVFKTLIYPLEKAVFNLRIQTVTTPRHFIKPISKSYEEAANRINLVNAVLHADMTEFESDSNDFNEMLERSTQDIQMLMTQSYEGLPFVAAGIPWYVCLFGRDSILTARECMLLYPTMAKWTLHVLAKYQGTQFDPWRDEEPGKILHELRTGELASLGEVPHTPYYGSADATPLWLILLYEYIQWTNDTETLEMLWPNALAALAWIDSSIGQDPLQYLTYKTKSSKGIIHQGWKDSNNSAMYANGLQAEPPIALVEVQGYVYLAKKCMMVLAERMGDRALRQKLRKDCVDLKARFNHDFWVEEQSYYALGLDSQGTPLKVVASNTGHCLETGLLEHRKAHRVASRMMAPDMYSGWGIRTLSADMLAYNPMSYHNGSIWPHDNTIIGKGMASIGRTDLTEQIFNGLFEAARLMQYKRLPELFCGFSRDYAKADPPVRYAVACSPQSWAAASFFLLIQSMLNISPQLHHKTVCIKRPRLPHNVHYLRIKNLRIGDGLLDLEFKKADNTVLVDILSRTTKLDVMVKL